MYLQTTLDNLECFCDVAKESCIKHLAQEEMDELLTYVAWLEKMMVPGAKDHIIQIRPDFLSEDATPRSPSPDKNTDNEGNL